MCEAGCQEKLLRQKHRGHMRKMRCLPWGSGVLRMDELRRSGWPLSLPDEFLCSLLSCLSSNHLIEKFRPVTACRLMAVWHSEQLHSGQQPIFLIPQLDIRRTSCNFYPSASNIFILPKLAVMFVYMPGCLTLPSSLI